LHSALTFGSLSGQAAGFGFATHAGGATFGAAGVTGAVGGATGVTASVAGTAGDRSLVAASPDAARGSGADRSDDPGDGFGLPQAAMATNARNAILIPRMLADRARGRSRVGSRP
jgi:hypothetical protein